MLFVFQTFFTEKGSEKLKTFSLFCEFEVKISKGSSREVKKIWIFHTGWGIQIFHRKLCWKIWISQLVSPLFSVKNAWKTNNIFTINCAENPESPNQWDDLIFAKIQCQWVSQHFKVYKADHPVSNHVHCFSWWNGAGDVVIHFVLEALSNSWVSTPGQEIEWLGNITIPACSPCNSSLCGCSWVGAVMWGRAWFSADSSRRAGAGCCFSINIDFLVWLELSGGWSE
jgi:hypothetical protein